MIAIQLKDFEKVQNSDFLIRGELSIFASNGKKSVIDFECFIDREANLLGFHSLSRPIVIKYRTMAPTQFYNKLVRPCIQQSNFRTETVRALLNHGKIPFPSELYWDM